MAPRKNKTKENVLIILIVVLMVGCAGGFLLWQRTRQKQYEVGDFNENGNYVDYRTLEYKGKIYKYNNRIDTLLYIGVDTSEGDMADSQGQADTMVLFVLNKNTKKITALNISRDTMTTIRSYNQAGEVAGTMTQHLGYAYSFAGGGKTSCENVAWAVSHVLHGIPVEEYCATDISSIVAINDLVGGVTVTVPTDDLEAEFPEMIKGTQVKLNADNVMTFVRHRDTAVEFSNNPRRERQREYIRNYMPLLKERLEKDLDGTWNDFQGLEKKSITSVTRDEYLSMADVFCGMDVSSMEYITLKGEDRQGKNHDEFYLDEDALMEKLVEIFYISN